jgi:PPM family protein phosphatase
MSAEQRDSGEISIGSDATRSRESGESQAKSRIAVRCSGRTAVGQVRDHNEDNFVVANLETGSIRPRDQVFEDEVGDRGLVFAVCDGMGGAAAGEVASQMAVDILVEAMRRGGAPKNRDALARRLVSAVEEAGRRIFDSAQKERSRRGMGTTATVAVLVDKVLFLAEVGDSRAYLLRRGQLKQLTKDQSLVNQLIEAGHLTEDEAEAFEHSNIILQALGTSETVQVDLTFVELRRGDRLMMCSDGLSGLVHAEALRTTLDELKDPDECCAKLIEFAEAAGGHDNITVVVADFDGECLAPPVESDTFGYVQYPLPLSDDDASAFVDETTAAGGSDLRRSSDPEPDDDYEPLRDGASDHPAESLLPLSGDPGDSRANALWILGGVLALVTAVVVWFTLDPSVDEEPSASGPVVEPLSPAERARAAAQDVRDIEVTVHTDIEQATLLVNGDAKGELSPTQSRSLMLRPGAYRFEAHRGGNQIAATVATVRGDMPMNVFLQMPTGATERAAPDPEGGADESGAEARKSSTSASARRREERARRSAEPSEEALQPEAKPLAVRSTAEPEAVPPERTAPRAPAPAPSAPREPAPASPTPAQQVQEIPANPF